MIAKTLAKNGISAICAHTSLDIAKGGVNDTLASTLGFENALPFADEGELSIRHGVMSIPTLIVFKNGEIVNKSIGLVSKEEILALL